MSAKKPVVGLIFLVGLALVTAGAGFYTVFLPPKPQCPANPASQTVNVTLHQWGFIFKTTDGNTTDVTKDGWSICHGTTVKFNLKAEWEHNGPVAGGNYSAHGFWIVGIMPSTVVVHDGELIPVTLAFDTVGPFTLQCTEFCGESGAAGFGGHGTMRASITVL